MDLELIIAILLIIGIDIVLGGDNAIIIALACRDLPQNQRNKAIIFGTIIAIICRILLTIGAVYLLSIPFLHFVGGVLLYYIAFQLINDNMDRTIVKGSPSIMVAIKTIVVADIIMGIDNVMAVAGAAHGNYYLVIIGLLFSMPIIIWGSKLILIMMEKYPIIVYIGACILSFTAGKMIIHEPVVASLMAFAEWQMYLPYIMICVLLTVSLLKQKIA
ncbi:TerC family protein [Sutcliffiella rhizosphaerae]|uniref:TerC family protein n=1 Tax=Sutcliffiella rhizosphaerae TaxID=2880967 RepID=A0ABM8YS62_9BACI|nr:TerC family protein [Sutcliffiella rhizosphaerae]CAG9622841.1 hypothetical protein BACCIP111883_03632 [Sutcliffiella rhizosphaerae]